MSEDLISMQSHESGGIQSIKDFSNKKKAKFSVANKMIDGVRRVDSL